MTLSAECELIMREIRDIDLLRYPYVMITAIVISITTVRTDTQIKKYVT